MRYIRLPNLVLVLTIAVFGGLLSVGAHAAEPLLLSAPSAVTYLESEDIEVAGTTLRIMPGSVQDGLEIDDDSVTLSVPTGEALEIRSVQYPPRILENDIGQPGCNVLRNRQGRMFVTGPRVITIRPSSNVCPTDDYGSDNTPLISLDMPLEGQELAMGQSIQLFWQTEGFGASAVRIRLSTDGGLTFGQMVTDGEVNGGFYDWTVPTVYTTDRAVLKIEGQDGAGHLKSVDVSPLFRIAGENLPLPPKWDYDPQMARDSVPVGNIGGIFSANPVPGVPVCAPGLRVKSQSNPAVYLCGQDGRRHGFPNSRIHDSWYAGDYAGVVEINDESLASLPLGANVTYRPGVRMVKITTDSKVYAVAPGNILRWVPTEEAAAALYGEDWNQSVDDLSDAFFADYSIGDPLEFN